MPEIFNPIFKRRVVGEDFSSQESGLDLARVNFLESKTDKFLLMTTGISALVDFIFLSFFMPKGQPVLFYLLIVGEVFHFWQIGTYIYTVWQPEFSVRSNDRYTPPVDVYITVAGEPVEIVEQTARAAAAMNYPNFSVYLL